MKITIISNLCHVPGKARFPFLPQKLTFSWDDHWSLHPSIANRWWMTRLSQTGNCLHLVACFFLYLWCSSLWCDFSSPPCCLLPVSRTQSCRELRFAWLTVVGGCIEAPFFLLCITILRLEIHNSYVYLYLSVHLLRLREYAIKWGDGTNSRDHKRFWSIIIFLHAHFPSV